MTDHSNNPIPPQEPSTIGAASRRRHDAAGRRSGALILVVAAVLGAFVAGVVLREPVLHALGIHSESAEVAGAKGEKQLWTCSMHPQVIQEKPGMCPICGMALEPLAAGATATTSQADAGAIRIDPVVVQNMGVRVAPVRKGNITRTIRATGTIVQPTDALTDVNLRVSGWIEKLYADTEGMHVKKGDKLFELYSPALELAVQELQAARKTAQRAAAENEAARGVAETLVAAAERKLRLWGLDDEQVAELAKAQKPPRTMTFYSPADGEVAEKMVVQGAAVEAGMRVMRIVNRQQVWLDAQLFAMDLPFVKVGQRVMATVEGVRGEVEGEISFIYPAVDATTRTATVRVVLKNPRLELRPAMFATVQVPAELAKDALVIPREAVLDSGSRQVVFVTAADNHFVPREVKLGASGGEGDVQVVSGLKETDVVVTSGQFLMDTESRMKEAVAKHLAKGLMAPAGEHAQHGGGGAAPPKAVEPVKDQHAGHAAAEAPSAQWQAAVDGVMAEYLKLSEALGAMQTSDAPLESAPLVSAAEGMLKAAGDDNQKSMATYVQVAAKALGGKPLDQQREAFKALSDVTIEMATNTPANQKLYVFYCPMAKGSWLQRAEQRANPYYATEMKECAVLKREINAR